MQEVADHLAQHPQRAEHADHRRLLADLQQIDVEQRPKGTLAIRLDHRRHGVGDVPDRQELVGEW